MLLPAPRGSRSLILAYTVIYGTATMFYSGYSNTYANTAELALRHNINESYVQRGVTRGLGPRVESWLWSGVLNAHNFGTLVGTPLAPLFVDGLGRRWSLVLSMMVMLLASFAAGGSLWVRVPELLLASRLVGGVSVAVRHIAVLLLVIEASPTHLRGLCSFMVLICHQAGEMFGITLGMRHLLGEGQLLALLPVVAAPFALVGVLMSWAMKESPKFLLINRGSRQRAADSYYFYQGLAKGSPQLELAIEETLKEAAGEKHGHGGGKLDNMENGVFSKTDQERADEQSLTFAEGFADLWMKKHLRRGVTLGICSMLISVTVNSFTTELLQAHFDEDTAEMFSTLLIMINFTAGIAGTLIVDRLKRRSLFLSTSVVFLASLLCYVAFDRLAYYLVAPSLGYVCMASFLVYNIAYGLGVGPISFYLCGELLPQTHRSIGQSVAYFVYLLSAFLASFVSLPAYEFFGSWVFVGIFSLPGLLFLSYLWRWLPETSNREIEEIVAELMK